MTLLLFSLANEAEMYRLLAVATATAAISLIAVCAESNRPIWVSLPLYLLMLSCAITCSTTFWMHSYTIAWCIITIFVLAIATVVSAIDAIIKPMASTVRASIIRRSLTWGLPLFFFFLISWIVSAKFEYGVGFFDRIDQNQHTILKKTDAIVSNVDSMRLDMKATKKALKISDSTSKAYRDKLDARYIDVNGNLTDIKLRLTKLETDDQKRVFKERK